MKRPLKTGPYFRYLTLATLVGIFALSVLGGVVRITDSGLGCPDWPLCHGQIIPPFDAATLIEYSHRLVASVVGLLVLATLVVAWRRYRSRLWIFRSALFGLVLVIGQSILGGVAVLTELETWVVMVHMAMAQTLLACFVLISLDAWRGLSISTKKIDGRAIVTATAAIGVLFLILSGSYVALTGAAGACNQWPLCQGGKLWIVSELPLIHFAHRIASVLALVLIGAAAWTAYLTPTPKLTKSAIHFTLTIFAAQVLVGALTVLWGLPTALRALHVALATLTWAALVAATLLPFTLQARTLEGRHSGESRNPGMLP